MGYWRTTNGKKRAFQMEISNIRLHFLTDVNVVLALLNMSSVIPVRFILCILEG